MKELLEHIIKSIVNNPDEVAIDMKESVDFPGLQILTIKVADTDKGVVIGRKGRTINAIRDIVTISAIRNNVRVKVLVEEGEAGHRREDSPRRERDMDTQEDTKVEVGNEKDTRLEDATTEDMLNDEI